MKYLRLLIAAPILATSAITTPVLAGPPSPAASAVRTPSPRSAEDTRLTTEKAKLAAKLASAKNRSEAQPIEDELETLRSSTLKPATRLLMRRAQRNLTGEKTADAVADLGDAIALQKNEEVLWRLRARARLAAGDAPGAITDLGEALRLDSDDAESWSALSLAEEAQNDPTAALKAWQHVLTLNPNAADGLKRLEKLHLKAFGRPT
ncbi:hypothetical protein LOC54_00500 [Acetobacter sp. AN02]|uniref:tetratricopeptide repeat protein n=1 Tax=Acetobacter sp. AN02 TaxID=2894186 RepID=UPI0024341322|nr:hypothetical protein [Acetobacter sp. AN02]MDG6093604.1 hypothetical protein [Acetobacter sp. AN02]